MGPILSLDKRCGLERLVCTIFCNSAERLGGNIYDNSLVDFRNKNPLLLKVRLATDFAAWVKLRRTRAIAVTAPNLGLLSGDVANFCHRFSLVPDILAH